jgi:hypothetical protein
MLEVVQEHVAPASVEERGALLRVMPSRKPVRDGEVPGDLETASLHGCRVGADEPRPQFVNEGVGIEGAFRQGEAQALQHVRTAAVTNAHIVEDNQSVHRPVHRRGHLVPTEQGGNATLGHFLGNSAGKRLAARLRFASLEHNRTAVQDGKKHRCGIATGYMMAVNDIQLLATGAIDSHAQAEVDNVVDMQSTGTLGHLSP